MRAGGPPRIRGAALRLATRWSTWTLVSVVAVIAVLATVLVVQERAVSRHDALDRRRAAAVSAASREVQALLTVSASSSAADIKKLLAGATADFRDELQQQATAFQQALASGKVTSTGSVAATGLVSMTGRTAVVAVAAKQTIKNSSAPKGSPRNYRLTVTVTDVGGTWLASKLDFVV